MGQVGAVLAFLAAKSVSVFQTETSPPSPDLALKYQEKLQLLLSQSLWFSKK
jgi:hypothetical protein